MLSAIAWNGGAGTFNWNDAANWQGNAIPGSEDDVTIGSGFSSLTIQVSNSQAIRSLTSDAALTLTGGIFSFATVSTIVNLTIAGGTLSGTGHVAVTGTFNWTAGSLRGAGKLTIAAGATGSITGATSKYLGGTLENAGTLSYDGSNLKFGTNTSSSSTDSGTFNNLAGATFTIVDTSDLSGFYSTDSYTLNNAGTVVHSGTGTTDIDIAFNNSGTVAVQAGLLRLYSGGTSTGRFRVVASSWLQLDSTYVAAGAEISGAGTLTLNGGGSEAAPRLLEVAGQDLGSGTTNFSRIAALGTLSVAGYVQLVDVADNSVGAESEAMYVNSLQVSSGSTLDLNGFNVYAKTTQISGTIIGGTISGFDGTLEFPDSDGDLEIFELRGTHDIVNVIQQNDRAAWSSRFGNIGVSGEVDSWFFTLDERAGVFIDIDAHDVPIPLVPGTLNSEIYIEQLLENDLIVDVPNAINDDGFDFEGFSLPDRNVTSISELGLQDSSLYVELEAGAYFVKVRGTNNTVGTYELRMLADTHFDSTVPVLNSPHPNAPNTLLLDFDGHASSTDYFTRRFVDGVLQHVPYSASAFNLDGQTGFSPAERLAMYNIWQVVAADFNKLHEFDQFDFGVNVTTVEPANAATDRNLHRHVVTSSLPTSSSTDDDHLDLESHPGFAEVANFASLFGVAPPGPGYQKDDNREHIAFTFATTFDRLVDLETDWTKDFDAGVSGRIMADAYEMGDTTSHEFAHTLGLQHYNEFEQDLLSALLGLPRPAGSADLRPNSIMAQPKSGLRPAQWTTGNAWNGKVTVAQDDVNLIAASLGSPTTLAVLLDADDTVSVRRVGSAVDVKINGLVASGYQQTASAITQIGVRGGFGDNVIDLSQVTHADFPTIVGVTVLGNAGNDTVIGSEFDDFILGNSGEDNLAGGAGADTLDGGDGNDVVEGGAGNNDLSGGGGTDTLRVTGNSVLTITEVTASGGGTDTYTGFEQATLEAGAGNNRLDASAANIPVTLLGGDGNDTLLGGSQNDSLEGGDGVDVVESFGTNIVLTDASAPGFNGDLMTSVEGVQLIATGPGSVINASSYTRGPVTIIGSFGDDTLMGGAGDDLIIAGSGSDVVTGGPGDDQLFGHSGNDSLSGGSGNDTINGGSGRDSIDGGQNADVLSGGRGPDTIVGGDGDDLLRGGAGRDLLDGDDGDDTLDGGGGADDLAGGLGNDTLNGIFRNDSFNQVVARDTLIGGQRPAPRSAPVIPLDPESEPESPLLLSPPILIDGEAIDDQSSVAEENIISIDTAFSEQLLTQLLEL